MHGIPLAGLNGPASFIVSWKSSGRERSKDRNKWQSTTLASIYMYINISMYNKEGTVSTRLTMANTLPMQIRGPTPNGRYEYGLGLHRGKEDVPHLVVFIVCMNVIYIHIYTIICVIFVCKNFCARNICFNLISYAFN